MIIDSLTALIVSASLALLFFMAARHKMSEPRRFAATLAAYRILPDGLTALAAKLIPVLEMALAMMILLPQTRTLAAMLVIVLLSSYALAMALNLVRGRSEIDCGCGGLPQPLSPWLLLRNLLLIAVSGLLLLPATDRAILWSDGVLLILMTAVLAMVYALVEQLVRNQSLAMDRSTGNG